MVFVALGWGDEFGFALCEAPAGCRAGVCSESFEAEDAIIDAGLDTLEFVAPSDVEVDVSLQLQPSAIAAPMRSICFI